jgi:hypothetical protein
MPLAAPVTTTTAPGSNPHVATSIAGHPAGSARAATMLTDEFGAQSSSVAMLTVPTTTVGDTP